MLKRSAENMALSAQGQVLLQVLVDRIREGLFTPEVPESFMGYREMHDAAGLKKSGPHWGSSLTNQGMGELAEWVRLEGLPAITGLIVGQEKFEPGDGYYTVNGRNVGDVEWWANQIRSAILYDWSDFVDDIELPSYPELIDFTKLIAEGRLSMVSQITRSRCDTLRRRARAYYVGVDGLLACEVCGWSKPDNRFSGDIVELHHARPLAEIPADGITLTLADAISSMVPLCPSCHRCAHSRRGERSTFTIEELKSMIGRKP